MSDPMTTVPTNQHFDQDGWFTHHTDADPHPIREGAFMPAPWGATQKPLPSVIPEGSWPRFVSDEWVVQVRGEPAGPVRSLDEMKAGCLINLSVACEQQIVSGFKSSALGAEYAYPSKVTDQINLQASVIDSIVPGLAEGWTTPFWCEDADGNWAYRLHTAAQIQQVGRDGKASILASLERKGALELQIHAATSSEELDALHW